MVTGRIPWLRVLGEGAVIVSSILMAFGLQAWWEGLGDSERRAALLRGLSTDFAAAAVELDRVSGAHQRASSAAAHLLELARAGGTVPSDQAPLVDSLLSELYSRTTFDAPTGTLQALLSTGGLDVIHNAALVSVLSGWSAVIDNLVEDQLALNDHLSDRLVPYLQDNGISTVDLVWDRQDLSGVPWVPEHTHAHRLLSEGTFQSLIAERWFGSTAALDGVGAARSSLEEIRALIATELGDGA